MRTVYKTALALSIWLSLAAVSHAGVTGWSGSNYLRRQSQVYDTYPFMISIWGYRPSAVTVNADTMLWIGTDGSVDHARGAVRAGGTNNRVEAFSRSTSNVGATLAVDMTADQWVHFTGNFVATNSREILQDAANKVTASATISPNASNAVYIGVRSDVADNWPSTAGIAEASIWDLTSFTSGNRDSLSAKLAAGENPININAESAQPWTGKLVAYWPLTSTTDLTDASGNGHTLSTVGTLSNHASHPTIDAVSGGTPAVFFRRRVQ